MTAKPRFKSDAFEAIHSSASALHKVGAIDKATMRHFDEASLMKLTVFAPGEIKQLRESNNVSQPVFARYLNTSESTVEKWEAGKKKPSGIALKLLSVVQKHGLRVLAE
jgi:putative transcriptional regulator